MALTKVGKEGVTGISNSSNATAITIDSSENVGIGKSTSIADRVHIEKSGANCLLSVARTSDGAAGRLVMQHTDTVGALQTTGSVPLTLGTADTERMRIDASGVVTVGKTDAGSDVAGATIRGNGQASFTKASDGPLVLNRKTNQGYIALFQYDDTSIGQIGVDANDNFYITGQTGDTGGFYFNDAALSPAYQGAERDNFYDLGKSGARFDDIFATNATIQTSDQNEKQQIASLTDAEITAAKAISALFKTFKWKDKVESKGDAARTHSGVIAQEVQTAMSNAGLDAADYAFWCSDTWTDDDGNSQTRMGIRYPELLALVGAATEQRLADIETRLTALENV